MDYPPKIPEQLRGLSESALIGHPVGPESFVKHNVGFPRRRLKATNCFFWVFTRNQVLTKQKHCLHNLYVCLFQVGLRLNTNRGRTAHIQRCEASPPVVRSAAGDCRRGVGRIGHSLVTFMAPKPMSLYGLVTSVAPNPLNLPYVTQ